MSEYHFMEAVTALINRMARPIGSDWLVARHLMLDYQIQGVDYHRQVVAGICNGADSYEIFQAAKKLAQQYDGMLTAVTVFSPARPPHRITRDMAV